MQYVTIDSRYDPELLKELAGITNPWGYGEDADGWRRYLFAENKLDAFNDAIIQHDAIKLERQKKAKLAALAAFRWNVSQYFQYDGVRAPADTALVAVVSFVVANQIMPIEGTSVWKLTTNEFRNWTVTDIITYGISIRGHLQACFDREATLAAEILATETLEDLQSVDIGADWPT